MKKQFLIISILCLLSQTAPVLAADLNPLLTTSEKYRSIRVARVQAVDRILLEDDTRVSLIGIKGPGQPERKDVKRDEHGFIVPDDDPTTPFEAEALRYVRDLAEGKSVRLEFDVERRNDKGDLQAYVILADGRLLNAEIVRYGYADLRLRPPCMKYADQLRAAYQEARREMRGMQGQW